MISNTLASLDGYKASHVGLVKANWLGYAQITSFFF